MGSIYIYIYINKSNTVAPSAAATVLARLPSLPCFCPCPCSPATPPALLVQHATPSYAHATPAAATPAAATFHVHLASVPATPAAAKVLLHSSCSMPPAAAQLLSFRQALRWLFLHGVKTI